MQLSNGQDKTSIEKGVLITVFSLIILCAIYLRFCNLSERPVHTDEAENAYILGQDLNGKNYQFSPKHHHGPTLNYALKVPSIFTGKTTFQDLNIEELRSILAVVSIITLLLVWTMKRFLGYTIVISAIGVMSLSSLLIFYSNYVIHESLLGLFTIGLLTCSFHYISKPSYLKAIAVGLGIGLLFSTKITSSILLFSWFIAGVTVLFLLKKHTRSIQTTLVWKHIFLGVVTAALTTITLYSSFFQYWPGVYEAFASFFVYETENGHQKPWNYYLLSFLLPDHSRPFPTHETLMLVLACIGSASILWNSKKKMPSAQSIIGLFLILSTLCQLFIYSSISYKTPWLLLVTWLQLCLLSGYGFQFIWNQKKWVLFPACLGISIGVFLQWKSTELMTGRFHSDIRNPLVYAPTSRSILNLPNYLFKYEVDQVQVIGEYTWPLPWYLKHQSNIIYVDNLEFEKQIAEALILTDHSYEELKHLIQDEYQVFPYTLRPNVPVYLCIKNGLTPNYGSKK